MNIFKKLFNKKIKDPPKEEIKEPTKDINLANIAQFDDVWIKINDKIFEGWVVEKANNKVYICYTNENNKLGDLVFTIERPLNRSFIEQNNKTLFLNKDEIDT